MKVKFKPEVVELIMIRLKNDSSNTSHRNWVTITNNGSEQAYCKLFLEPKWFDVSEKSNNGVYTIISPSYLTQYVINKEHVMPYNKFEVTIEDEIFD